MSDADRDNNERRVLVLAPTDKDATLTRTVLGRAGVACVCCSALKEVCNELDLGAAAVLLAEVAVSEDQDPCLLDWLARQPPWSDLPILVLARSGAESAAVAQAMDRLGNVTVLERPTRVAALVSAVRSALRARERQYQNREHAKELRAAQEQLQLITDSMAAIVIRCSRDLRYLWISGGCASWLGQRAEDIIGKPIVDVIGARAFESVRPHMSVRSRVKTSNTKWKFRIRNAGRGGSRRATCRSTTLPATRTVGSRFSMT